MKKKLIIINSIIVFVSLLFMLFISIIIVDKQNEKIYNKKALEYLTITTELFDGTNAEQTANTLKSADNYIRLTIIDKDGNVVYDSDNSTITENHLDRPEIKNLGKVSKRYSKTLDCDMLYVAEEDSGYFVRVSIKITSINGVIDTYILIGSISLVVILSLSVYLIFLLSKKSLDPINKTVKSLATLAGDYDIDDITIDDLPTVLFTLNGLIDSKMKEISKQKEELNSLINQISQGIIVIDNSSNVKIVNNEIINIFKVNENIIGKNYIYLIRNTDLQNAISNSLTNKKSCDFELKQDDKYYHVVITYVCENWLNDGLILTFIDITKDIILMKTKKDFFSNASHELKSPLTTIMGYLQMITEGIIDDSEIKEYIEKASKEASRMNNIILDMLDLSSLEQDCNIIREKVNVDLVLADILDSLKARIDEKGLTLKTNIEKTSIISSNKLIDEVIRNLVDNAIKYTNEGSITVTLKDNTLTVTDTGIGIPKLDLERVFERFYRVDKGRSKSMGGTGLGLAIVKHICEIYKYDISLESKINEGTTIKIKF